jgi:hypothetical protein
MMLVQAARIITMRPHSWPNFSFGIWLPGAVAGVLANEVAIVLANRLSRIP